MPTHKSSKQGRSRRSRLAASRAGGGEPEIRRRQAVWGSTRKARSELGRAARPERAPACEKALREKASEVKVVRAFYHVQRHETQWQLRCEAISGRTVRPMVRLEDIEDLHAFRRVMAKAGFSFANDPARARRVHEDVMRQARRAAKDRGREVRLTSELGWHDDGAAFVLPGATYPRDARLRFEPEQKRAYAVARKSGTFGGWKAEVAGPAACSSRMVFGIGAALKPPLLLYAGKRAGGVAVTVEGPSRSGKSITLMAAKSVIDEPVLDSWGLSRAGGTAALLGHTDLPLFLDETRAVRGGEAKGGSIVGEVTRLLGGGRPDILDPSWVAEHRQAAGRAAIRSVLLTSTEGRLDPARLPGERARMVALPACRPGSFGVIDHPERADPPIRDAAAAAEAMERLERGAGRHHGQALPRFVRRLVKMKRGRVQKLIREYRDAFYKTADGAALGGWSRSILEWFALVYAALMLARRLKIVPWPEAVIRDAVLRCWRDAMEQEARAADAPLQVVERLRCWLRDAPERAVVGADFDPRRLNKYDVVLDRDAGVPVALAQRKRLAGIAGGEAPLDAALLLLRQRGDVVPNPKTGQVTRQKRFKGTSTKLRFVFFTQAFLDGAENG